MKKNIVVIGSGFSALSAACYLAKAGNKVTIYEKNSSLGGRARQLAINGFTFDMGPTWYWMPDVFERFFSDFNKKPSDYYELTKLNPAYQVYFGDSDSITIEDTLEKICAIFEIEEPGSAAKLRKFIANAQDNYRIAIEDMVYLPGVSPAELLTPASLKKVTQFFNSISSVIRKEFHNPRLIALLEFPALFLGAKPSKTPSFYSFMNYADFGLGTFYPNKGMYSVVEGMVSLAQELGVIIKTNQNVSKIIVNDKKATAIQVGDEIIFADIILSGADYYHTEGLLNPKFRQYSENYWDRRIFAPSCLLFYVGFNKKLQNLSHHTLFFDVDFEQHSKEIYDQPKWPENPLFYASFPSMTDSSAAPEGYEAGIFLIPLAPGLDDIPELREEYFTKIIERLEMRTSQNVSNSIIVKESFCIKDFISDYNSYKGNAYGLANTLRQTAFLRPKLKSKKIANLFFTGQLTVPGPGVPPSLISGKLAAGLIQKDYINERAI